MYYYHPRGITLEVMPAFGARSAQRDGRIISRRAGKGRVYDAGFYHQPRVEE